MLNIYTCIISRIIFGDLVPNLYFYDTDTWDSCDTNYLDYMTFLDLLCYLFLWSRVLVILWLYYTIVTRPGHLMFIICMSHHACTVSLYTIYHLDFSVIVITFSSRYCQTYRASYFNALLVLLRHFHILSFTVLFPSCTLTSLLLMNFIIFQYLDQKDSIKSWS